MTQEEILQEVWNKLENAKEEYCFDYSEIEDETNFAIETAISLAQKSKEEEILKETIEKIQKEHDDKFGVQEPYHSEFLIKEGFQAGQKSKDEEWREKINKRIEYFSTIYGNKYQTPIQKAFILELEILLSENNKSPMVQRTSISDLGSEDIGSNPIRAISTAPADTNNHMPEDKKGVANPTPSVDKSRVGRNGSNIEQMSGTASADNLIDKGIIEETGLKYNEVTKAGIKGIKELLTEKDRKFITEQINLVLADNQTPRKIEPKRTDLSSKDVVENNQICEKKQKPNKIRKKIYKLFQEENKTEKKE